MRPKSSEFGTPSIFLTGLFVQLGDPNIVLVDPDVLRHNIYCDFCEIQIRVDLRHGRNPGAGKDRPNPFHCELVCREFVKFQEGDRADGITVDVVQRDVFQINVVNL